MLTAPGLAAGAEPTAELGAPPTPAPATVPDQIIVQWTDGAGRHGKEEAREEAEVTYRANLGDPSFQLVTTVPGQTVADAVAELEAAPAVAIAEPDTYAAPTDVPDDPLFADQWALRNDGSGIEGFSGAVAGDDIDALGAWEVTVGDPAVVVADIDTGYRFDSPDLGPVAWENPGEIPGNGIDDDHNGYVDDVHGWDFVGEDAEAATEDDDPTDSNLISGGHGVHTAGIIGAAGDNGVGITGVAQDVRLMPLRVCANAPASNKALCPTSSLIAAINYAGRNGAKVANISLTGTSPSVIELNALAENPGTLYVASAGNDGEDNEAQPHYPCNYDPAAESGVPGAVDNVVCVAATDQADGLAAFSDWGARSVDLGAPGTQILSTYPAEDNVIADDFEAEDFNLRWRPQFGAEGGFELTEEAPLTSLGISDSPGSAPVPKSTRGSQLSAGVPVAAADGACTLSGLDSVKLAGGTAKVFVFRNGSLVHNFSLSETSGAGMSVFRTALMTDLAGGTVNLILSYTAGAAPTAAAGMWIDNLKLSCAASLATPPTYAYLDGTSMAAPQVSGAAALLFSAEPSASVEEVAYALDEGADPVASLAGKTISGGRLDAARALAWLQPAAPALTIEPSTSGEATDLRVRGTTSAGARVRLFADASCGGPAVGVGTPAEFSSPGFAVHVAHGSHTDFTALVETPHAVSSCSEAISYTNISPVVKKPVTEGGGGEGASVPPPGTSPSPTPTPVPVGCTVPRLLGKTLGQAKAALKHAGCKLGKAKVRVRKGVQAGAPVVTASSPAAGAVTAGKVSVRLTPKPRKTAQARRLTYR